MDLVGALKLPNDIRDFELNIHLGRGRASRRKILGIRHACITYAVLSLLTSYFDCLDAVFFPKLLLEKRLFYNKIKYFSQAKGVLIP